MAYHKKIVKNYLFCEKLEKIKVLYSKCHITKTKIVKNFFFSVVCNISQPLFFPIFFQRQLVTLGNYPGIKVNLDHGKNNLEKLKCKTNNSK